MLFAVFESANRGPPVCTKHFCIHGKPPFLSKGLFSFMLLFHCPFYVYFDSVLNFEALVFWGYNPALVITLKLFQVQNICF